METSTSKKEYIASSTSNLAIFSYDIKYPTLNYKLFTDGIMETSLPELEFSNSEIEITESNTLNIKSSLTEINDLNTEFIIQSSESGIKEETDIFSSMLKLTAVNSISNIEDNEYEEEFPTVNKESISNIENTETEIQSFITKIGKSTLEMESNSPKIETELISLETELETSNIESTNLKESSNITLLSSYILKSDLTNKNTNFTC